MYYIALYWQNKLKRAFRLLQEMGTPVNSMPGNQHICVRTVDCPLLFPSPRKCLQEGTTVSEHCLTKQEKNMLFICKIQTNSLWKLWLSCQRMAKIIPSDLKKFYGEVAIGRHCIVSYQGQLFVSEIIDGWSTPLHPYPGVRSFKLENKRKNLLLYNREYLNIHHVIATSVRCY